LIALVAALHFLIIFLILCASTRRRRFSGSAASSFKCSDIARPMTQSPRSKRSPQFQALAPALTVSVFLARINWLEILNSAFMQQLTAIQGDGDQFAELWRRAEGWRIESRRAPAGFSAWRSAIFCRRAG
jgi:hypothetical protein